MEHNRRRGVQESDDAGAAGSRPARLDVAMVEQGLVASRSRARDLIARGLVSIAGETVLKPSYQVFDRGAISLDPNAEDFVSRGALKLATALDYFSYDVTGITALDIGASTGGFTEVLLSRGASHVFAVDVGREQLHPRLRADRRVTDLQRTDARTLTAKVLGLAPQALVADVSFISLSKALATPISLLAPAAWLIALIKPQFEAGREAVGKGGIVRSAAARKDAVDAVHAWVADQPGWKVDGVIPSPISGADGNEEFLIGARRD